VITGAVEGYLKAIYALQTREEAATTSSIAARMDVSLPSVSAMLKRLESEQLVARARVSPRSVRLTPQGEAHALRVIRRHRLLETFLARVVGLPWDEIHAEAELLEHAVSDRLLARIDTILGHPTHDPHGDPVPPEHGTHCERWADPLSKIPDHSRFRVERVCDRDSAALRYLATLGIRPSVELEVEGRDPFGGPLWVRVAGCRHALGPQLTTIVHGTVLGEGESGRAEDHPAEGSG
jgi:DtxR family transcriptional regulator, Mn-dependent transcriptional regulator